MLQDYDVNFSLESEDSGAKCIAETFSKTPDIPDELNQLISENETLHIENRYLKENVTKLENEVILN